MDSVTPTRSYDLPQIVTTAAAGAPQAVKIADGPLTVAGTPGAERTIELPSVAAELAKGESLFLTVSPVSDMSVGHGSRTPGGTVLVDATVRVPVVE